MVTKTFDFLKNSDTQTSIPLKELCKLLIYVKISIILKDFFNKYIFFNFFLKYIALKINFSKHELFLTKQKTDEQLHSEFESHFSETNVSKQDFIQYYEEINLSLPSDSNFIQLIEKSWGVTENPNNEKDREIILEIMEILRKSLFSIIKGKNDLETITKLFMSFDVKTSFSLTFDEFVNAVKKMHLKFEEKLLGAVFKRIDLNNSGYIEFQEFCDFLLN